MDGKIDSESGKKMFVIFSDLDGTLLDHASYSFEPALPALEALKESGIPLVLCSSKTRFEIESLRKKLANEHPFIIENGGGIYLPKKYFRRMLEDMKEDPEYWIIPLGIPYSEIRNVLERIRSGVYERIRGFGDLAAEEVALLCDFSLEDAQRAKQREYDEPFFLEDKGRIGEIEDAAGRSNLRILRGSRFFHLMGNTDKGKAVNRLKKLFAEEYGSLTTIGLGDSPNDKEMLEAVDHPILLKKPDGTHDSINSMANLIHARSIGPQGWNEAVMDILHNLKNSG